MTEKIKYSVWIGILKAIKNNAIVLIPFLLAVYTAIEADLPLAIAPMVSFVAYFLKNLYENKISK
jgi:hypothetical protein